MKLVVKFLISAVTLVPMISHANKKVEIKPGDAVKLVECNMTSGDYKQVAIFTLSDGTLALQTTDRLGAAQAYELPRREWRARAVIVPCWQSIVPSVCGTLYEQSESKWSYEITGSQGVSVGLCR
jgi:hypothetical protein